MGKLPTDPRPGELGWWFRFGRRLFGRKHMPTIESIPEFEGLWVGWWSAAQPKWRDTTTWPISRDEGDIQEWGQLSQGGKDGLFLVVMSLAWWIHAQHSVPNCKLSDAITDVSWVLDHLITSLSVKATICDSSPPNIPPSSKTKRSSSTGASKPRKRVRK